MRTGRHGGAMMWVALAACAIVMLAAMTWLTREVLASERQRQEAEARAEQQERVRLALWRMDALGASTLLGYNQQTAEAFRAVDPCESRQDGALLHFDLTEKGKLTLSGGLKDHERPRHEFRRMLVKLRAGGGEYQALSAMLPKGTPVWSPATPVTPAAPVAREATASDAAPGAAGRDVKKQDEFHEQAKPTAALRKELKEEQRARLVEAKPAPAAAVVPPLGLDSLSQEAAYRQKAVEGTSSNLQQLNRTNALTGNAPKDAAGLPEGGDAEPFHATWWNGNLFLLRRVEWTPQQGTKHTSIQGVWLDAEKLSAALLGEVRDLLPNARLEMAGRTSFDALTMASLPWSLQAGNFDVMNGRGAVKNSLWFGWLTAIAAIGVAAVLVRGVMRLSERRASFVSAVTHELRTPLTTFRLYSDMLESGVVKEERRGEYFRTLRREADRLAHLVENVLAFSRIERGSARTEVQETSAGKLLESMRERFEARLASAGLTLGVEVGEAIGTKPFRVDAASVEHVLFNLIDNAAKYAAGGDPKRVVLSAVQRGERLAICVRDFGPGISARERRKIFRPFHKSAQAAAESQPGVGLGLALSQRLAHELGGRLTHEEPVGGGAVFCLELPVKLT